MKTETVLITGNTFPVKESLKALGGRWNAAAKGWDVPADKADEAKALVGPARNGRDRPGYANPGSWTGRRRRYGSTYTRFSSGAETFTNRNGRCEDAPCCGCCS